MQHGDIGFFEDVFSLLLVLTVVLLSLLTMSRYGGYEKPAASATMDGAYVGLTVVNLFSYLILAQSGNHYQNILIIVAGCLVYISFRLLTCIACSQRLLAICNICIILLMAWQYLAINKVCAVFSNQNYLAGYLAVTVPMLAGAALVYGKHLMRRAITYAIVAPLSAAVIALIRGRSALIGVGAGLAVMIMPLLIVWWRKVGAWLPPTKALQRMLFAVIFFIVCALAMPAARQIHLIKPISGAGRVLIWSVAARMAAQAPLAGVGFGNFANTYNLYQADYFAHGSGSVPQRMAADNCRHAFNEPLEIAAELGLPGLLLLAVFCALIVKQVWEVVKRTAKTRVVVESQDKRRDAASILGTDWLTVGMAGSVVCFMVMSLFHFPRKVVPTWLVFNYALACIVTVNQRCKQGVNELKRSHKTLVVVGWRVFWLLAFVGSAALLPLYVKNYRDARRWIAAHELMVTGEFARASAAYTELYPKLKCNGRFCAYYGNAVMAASEKSNTSALIDGRAARQAVALYEKAKYTYPDPYMFENLALAYLRLADGTNCPVVVRTRYRMETPAQVLMRKLREWRCGTNLFFEPPATELTQSDCIGRAIDYLTLASDILPWRLTSKWYLAQVYRNVGDVSNAMKYAQVVVNIPMKKDTPQGREFKRKAQKMLNEIGVQCDDPGMVVFDIWDRRAWNEGKW
ncbi:MAG: O-antigen ligase family protein [bacterium]|nr:O-antigen ligase family protein [bacterium]